MSTKVIRVATTNGTPILVSVCDVEEVGGPTNSLRAKQPLVETSRLEDVGRTAGEICSTLYEHVSGAMHDLKPDKVVIRFGLSLTGQAGIPLITEGSAEASFRIQATWHTRTEPEKSK